MLNHIIECGRIFEMVYQEPRQVTIYIYIPRIAPKYKPSTSQKRSITCFNQLLFSIKKFSDPCAHLSVFFRFSYQNTVSIVSSCSPCDWVNIDRHLFSESSAPIYIHTFPVSTVLSFNCEASRHIFFVIRVTNQ